MFLKMYRFFFGFVFKCNLNPSAFFSVLFKSLILIHEFTSPTPKRKGSPTPAGYKAARSAESTWRAGADAPWRHRPACARRPHPPRRPAAGTPARAAPLRWVAWAPSPPSSPARSRLRAPGSNRDSESEQQRRRRLARNESRPSSAQRGEKGVNPEVYRPPASQWQHGGNKSGPAKEGRGSGSRTATCCESCHFPTLPCPSPSLALAPPPFFLLLGTELPSTLLTCQTLSRERRPHRRAHPATLALARPRGALLTSGASWSRR